MSDNHAADLGKHVRNYILVFVALLILTGVTVLVASFDVSTGMAVLIALFVASIKGSLVACFFMHLISERKLIYWILIVTGLFFLALLMGPIVTSVLDHIGG